MLYREWKILKDLQKKGTHFGVCSIIPIAIKRDANPELSWNHASLFCNFVIVIIKTKPQWRLIVQSWLAIMVGFNKAVKVWPRNNQKSVRDGLDPDQSFKAQVHIIEDLFTWSWNMCSAHHINFGVAWKDHQLLLSVKALVWLCNRWVWEWRVVFPILQINQILVALLLAISESWYPLMWEDELT